MTTTAPNTIRLLSPTDIEAAGGPATKRQAKLRARGEFCEYVRLGGRVFYRQDAWDEYLRRQTRTSTADDGAQRAA